jgi:hypothetical protein
VAANVDADARFRFTGRPEPTTLRRQVEQAARSLRTDCAPEQAKRLEVALP